MNVIDTRRSHPRHPAPVRFAEWVVRARSLPLLLSAAVLGASLPGAAGSGQGPEGDPSPTGASAAEGPGEELRIGSYYVDRYEYPNRRGSMPTVSVTWAEAQSLCESRGKRLCREAEWEMAARGRQGLSYGYGSAFESGRCNTPYLTSSGEWRRGGTAASGQYQGCESDYGVADMIGNVWEWTDGWYDSTRTWRVVRGGSWFNNLNFARADGRYGSHLTADFAVDLVGFRCCRSAVDVESD